MTLFNDSIFITDEVAGIRQCRETRSETSMTAILCQAGYIDVELNGRTHHIGPDDLFIRIPAQGAVLGPYKHSDDYRFIQVSFDESFFEDMMFEHLRLEPQWWEKREYLRDNLVFHVGPGSIDLCHTYFNLLRVQLLEKPTLFRQEILTNIARAATMELLSFLDKTIDFQSTTSRESMDSSDYIFREFMRMLHQYPHQREVQWFAQQLSITPKYLSEISKARSGKSASEWIAEVTVSELKHLLRHSTLSIRDVAREMEFPNASFFCQYTKKHTGLTPNHFRKQKHD